MLGDSIVLFQFARPKKPEIDPRIKPAGLAAIPATAAIGMMLLGAAMLAVLLLVAGPIGVVGVAVTAGVMAVRQRSKEPLFALCLLAMAPTLGSFGMYLSYLVEPTVEVEVDERMAQVMGVTYEQDDEPEPEPEEEEEELKEEELKQPEEKQQKKKQVEPDKVVKTKLKKYSDEAKKARGVGVAASSGPTEAPERARSRRHRVHRNNLDDLFAKGWPCQTRTERGLDFVAGGEGIRQRRHGRHRGAQDHRRAARGRQERRSEGQGQEELDLRGLRRRRQAPGHRDHSPHGGAAVLLREVAAQQRGPQGQDFLHHHDQHDRPRREGVRGTRHPGDSRRCRAASPDQGLAVPHRGGRGPERGHLLGGVLAGSAATGSGPARARARVRRRATLMSSVVATGKAAR